MCNKIFVWWSLINQWFNSWWFKIEHLNNINVTEGYCIKFSSIRREALVCLTRSRRIHTHVKPAGGCLHHSVNGEYITILMRTIKCRQSTNQMREYGKIWIMSCAQCRQWSFQKSPSCVWSAPTAVEPSVRFVCSLPTYSNVWMVDEWCLFTPLACFLASHLRLLALPNGHMAVYGVVSTANSANGWLGCHCLSPYTLFSIHFQCSLCLLVLWALNAFIPLSRPLSDWSYANIYFSIAFTASPYILLTSIAIAGCLLLHTIFTLSWVRFCCKLFFTFALFYLLLSMPFFNIEINLLTNSYSTCST